MAQPTSTPSVIPAGAEVVAFHRACLAAPGWPADGVVPAFPASAASAASAAASAPGSASVAGADVAADPALSPWHWIATNHRFNCRLWAEEDLARRTRVSDAEIAANKRAIDGFNQARNDATERVDELLLLALGLVDAATAASDAPTSLAGAGARLNSETAGSMIDRLSILSLKVDAMTQQTERTDVDDAHRAASRGRLARLIAQRDDLAGCLDGLVADCRAGRAYFKVYRQFKMYNDPRFNPVLVAEARRAG